MNCWKCIIGPESVPSALLSLCLCLLFAYSLSSFSTRAIQLNRIRVEHIFSLLLWNWQQYQRKATRKKCQNQTIRSHTHMHSNVLNLNGEQCEDATKKMEFFGYLDWKSMIKLLGEKMNRWMDTADQTNKAWWYFFCVCHKIIKFMW